MEISKELLSEVLGEDVRLGIYTTVESDEDELVQHIMKIEIYGNRVSYWRYYKEWDDGSTMVRCQINIYELQHLCKEWAFTQGYELRSGRDIDVKEELCYFCEYKQERQLDYTDGDYFLADNELDSVMKTCEWVLKEINEKQLQH